MSGIHSKSLGNIYVKNIVLNPKNPGYCKTVHFCHSVTIIVQKYVYNEIYLQIFLKNALFECLHTVIYGLNNIWSLSNTHTE